MGIQADNAKALVETFEAMTSDMRQDARDAAARLAKRALRPLSDFAQAVADAEDQQALEKALAALEKEAGRAGKIADKTWRKHLLKEDTEVGNLRDNAIKVMYQLQTVKDIARDIENAALHDIITQEFRNMEKGLREAGL